MQRFLDKRVWITGASSGIGQELARAFAREGAKVGLAARREPLLDELAAELGQCVVTPCDVINQDSVHFAVQKMVATYGGIDIVVANAGFGVHGAIDTLSVVDFHRQFEVNVFGVVRTLLTTLPYLKDSKGQFVVMGSVLGRFGYPWNSAYCASKFAVNGLCESIESELKDVSVTCLNPGIVESNIARVDNANQFQPNRPDTRPSRFMVSTPKAVSEMMSAIHRKKRQAVITGHGRWFVRLRVYAPFLFRWILKRFVHPKRHD